MNKKSKNIKARLYIGGLRSILSDMSELLTEVEKTGEVPSNIEQSLLDVSEAIQMTIKRLKMVTNKCCDHSEETEEEIDEDEKEEEAFSENCLNCKKHNTSSTEDNLDEIDNKKENKVSSKKKKPYSNKK